MFYDSLYRFLAKEKSIFIKYKDKEKIFINSNLTDEEKLYNLGYNIKK